jgi:hypothetical protein
MATKKPTKKKAGKRIFNVPKETTLEAHLESFKKMAADTAASGATAGACLITDPQSGQSRCIRTDPATCKALKGVFIGGPCGG